MPGSPTIQDASRHSSNILAKSLIIQMGRRMPIIQQNATKLTTLVLKTAKKKVGAQVWHHREDELMPTEVTFSGATETSAQTAVAASSFSNKKAIFEDVILWNSKRDEHLHCTASNYSGNFTFARNLHGSGGLLYNGDKLKILAPAREIGDTTPAARHTLETLKTFYLQVIRQAFSITDVMEATETYHGNDRMYQHDKMLQQFKVAFELNGLFSHSSSDIGGTTFEQPTSMGLYEHVTVNTNTINYLTYPEFEKTLEAPSEFHNDGNGWMFLCSPLIARIINGWGRGQMQTTKDDDFYGYNVKKLVTTYGDIAIVPHPLLVGSTLSGLGWLIPLPLEDYIQIRYLAGNGKNHDVKLVQNQQVLGSQTIIDEVHGKLGWEFWEAAKFARIDGVVG